MVVVEMGVHDVDALSIQEFRQMADILPVAYQTEVLCQVEARDGLQSAPAGELGHGGKLVGRDAATREACATPMLTQRGAQVNCGFGGAGALHVTEQMENVQPSVFLLLCFETPRMKGVETNIKL
jgi:hypothetical protein